MKIYFILLITAAVILCALGGDSGPKEGRDVVDDSRDPPVSVPLNNQPIEAGQSDQPSKPMGVPDVGNRGAKS